MSYDYQHVVYKYDSFSFLSLSLFFNCALRTVEKVQYSSVSVESLTLQQNILIKM
jgi:hypothetical protein